LRVLSGRLKAVLVATLVTIVLIGALGPAATFASDPAGLSRFMYAMGQVESGGNYDARNPTSGAYGKYQIMPSNWPSWALRYLGNASARQTPANQEVVAAGKFRDLYRSLQSWRRVAYWWLTGSSRTTDWSSYATRYVNKVMAIYANTPEKAATVTQTTHRYSERNARITYGGTWRLASHPAYAGDAAKYATKAGASASFAFSGSKVIWYGPVGPTRGKARVLIDGTYVKTVNLYSSTFTARKAVFSKSWATAGAHTLRIEVVGTAGHPYVAIDGFTVVD
jgi:hypothetical protein